MISPVFDLYYPLADQVHNRSNPASVIDNLTIIGSMRFGTSDIEAKWGNGNWTTIATDVRGVFTATLAGCSGQATLSVRPVGYPALQVDRTNVGIGDVFLLIGQSNCSGRGSSLQTWSHATLTPMMFANDYTWKTLVDPIDGGVGQVDSVSSDGLGTSYVFFQAYGSIWLPVATQLMVATGAPVAFIPCPKGATTIAQWAPGAAGSHQSRTTLYGQAWARVLASMGNVYRATNTIRCALWWQGEGDQFTNTQENYNAALDTLANTLYAEMGAKIMPQYKLQALADSPGYVDAAVAEAVADNANVLLGPDMSGIIPDNDDSQNVHIIGNANLSATATLWADAIKVAFGW